MGIYFDDLMYNFFIEHVFYLGVNLTQKTPGVDKLRQEIRSYTIFIQPTAIILNTANSTILAVCTKGTNYITNGGSPYALNH